MGTITVNLPENVEKTFRTRVASVKGMRKGALGEAIAEAMTDWTRKHTHHDEAMRLLEEGWDGGTFAMPSREDIHDRH